LGVQLSSYASFSWAERSYTEIRATNDIHLKGEKEKTNADIKRRSETHLINALPSFSSK
jgi:hypothetical protein